MKKIFFLLVITFSVSLFPQEIKEKTDDIIKSVLGSGITFEFQKYKIPKNIKPNIESSVRQKFYGDHVYIYKIFSEKKIKAYAILDNVLGKSMPITFIVIFDIDGSIISTDIVKYREPIGGGVSSEKWNGQFKGKNSKSDYTIGKEIDTITGATISVNSVTAGIRKLSLLFDNIKDKI